MRQRCGFRQASEALSVCWLFGQIVAAASREGSAHYPSIRSANKLSIGRPTGTDTLNPIGT